MVLSGSNWARNHSRCCANDNGNPPSRGIFVICELSRSRFLTPRALAKDRSFSISKISNWSSMNSSSPTTRPAELIESSNQASADVCWNFRDERRLKPGEIEAGQEVGMPRAYDLRSAETRF